MEYLFQEERLRKYHKLKEKFLNRDDLFWDIRVITKIFLSFHQSSEHKKFFIKWFELKKAFSWLTITMLSKNWSFYISCSKEKRLLSVSRIVLTSAWSRNNYFSSTLIGAGIGVLHRIPFFPFSILRNTSDNPYAY